MKLQVSARASEAAFMRKGPLEPDSGGVELGLLGGELIHPLFVYSLTGQVFLERLLLCAQPCFWAL